MGKCCFNGGISDFWGNLVTLNPIRNLDRNGVTPLFLDHNITFSTYLNGLSRFFMSRRFIDCSIVDGGHVCNKVSLSLKETLVYCISCLSRKHFKFKVVKFFDSMEI